MPCLVSKGLMYGLLYGKNTKNHGQYLNPHTKI